MKKRTRNRFCPSAISLAVAVVLGCASIGAMAYPCTGGSFSVTQTGPSTIPDGVCINIATTNSKGLDAFGGDITDKGPLTITLTGAGGTYGVSTDNGHNVNLRDTQISTAGNASFGIYAANNNSLVTSNNNLTIQTLGTNSWAIWADSNAKIVLHTTDVTTTGKNSYGLYASAGGNITGVAGVKVDTSSGSGARTYGFFATGLNSVITLAGGSLGTMIPANVVITGGDNSDGLRAQAGGLINITGPNSNNAGIYTTTINTSASGNSTVGVHATGASSQIKIKGRTSIVTGGNNSFGVQADGAGRVSFTDYVNIDTVSAIGDNTYGVYASGAGSSVKFANNIDIATGGVQSFGIYADSAGVVQNTGGITNINSNGLLAGKIGLYASGVDSLIDLGTTNIVTRGATSSGVRADLSATVNIHGALSVDTSGVGASTFGLHSKDLGSSINIDGPAGQQNNILTGGDNSYGVYADNGGKIVLGLGAGTLIDTTSSGDNTIGVYASNIDSVSKAVGNASNIAFTGGGTLTIQTAGLNSYGMYAEAGSSISNTGSTTINSINTSNSGKIGIYASGAGSSITLADASVTTRGYGASGVRADNGGTVNIKGNVQIDTSGSGSNTFGIHSTGIGSVVMLNDGNITTDGANSHGLVVDHGGVIVVNGSLNVVTVGDNSAGVLVDDSATGFSRISIASPGSTNTITTYGANSYGIGFIDNTISVPVAHLDNITINTYGAGADALYIDPDQQLINNVLVGDNFTALRGNVITLIGGNRNITTDSSHLASVNGLGVSAQSNTNLNLNLTNSSSLIGAIVQDGTSAVNLSVDPSSSWSFAQNSLLQSVNNSGTINLTTINTSATVLGDYNSSNGLLKLNSELGPDGSPTAKLIVQGSTSGTGRVAITNVKGAGAKKVNGIEVISVAGASNATFTLQGRAVAGAYEYALYQNGVNNTDGNWYLRSVAPNPDNGGNAPVPTPQYRPEIGTYLANQVAARGMFVHTLHDRLGEPQYTDKARQALNKQNHVNAAWVRVVGNITDSTAMGGDISQSSHTGIVQAGGDVASWSTDNNKRWHLGIMAGAGGSKTRATIKDDNYIARGEVTGYNVGLYGTWYSNDTQKTGPYVDVWGQYSWYNNTVKGELLNTENYKSSGMTASVEGGWAFLLRKDPRQQLLIEPQVQVIYSGYSAKDHTEVNGTEVHSDRANGVITRVGARFYGRNITDNNRLVQPFIEMNWWHSSINDNIAFDNAVISENAPKDRYELKLGVEAEILKNWNIWTHVGLQTGKHDFSRIEGLAGVKYSW